MTRTEALALIKRYQHEDPEVLLSAFELEWGEEIPWETETYETTPWRPKEFASDLEYQMFISQREMLRRMSERMLSATPFLDLTETGANVTEYGKSITIRRLSDIVAPDESS